MSRRPRLLSAVLFAALICLPWLDAAVESPARQDVGKDKDDDDDDFYGHTCVFDSDCYTDSQECREHDRCYCCIAEYDGPFDDIEHRCCSDFSFVDEASWIVLNTVAFVFIMIGVVLLVVSVTLVLLCCFCPFCILAQRRKKTTGTVVVPAPIPVATPPGADPMHAQGQAPGSRAYWNPDDAPPSYSVVTETRTTHVQEHPLPQKHY